MDDHEALRVGVGAILRARSDIEVCGEAANGWEAIEKSRLLKPDLVILDISMPVLDGFSAAREISKVVPRAAILLLTMHDSPNMIKIAKVSGASGYVGKSEGISVLLKAVDAVARNKTFFPE